eukprot:scaffold1333_cov86-Cylindrotheca_fusiformis.AAC.5
MSKAAKALEKEHRTSLLKILKRTKASNPHLSRTSVKKIAAERIAMYKKMETGGGMVDSQFLQRITTGGGSDRLVVFTLVILPSNSNTSSSSTRPLRLDKGHWKGHFHRRDG